MRRNAASRSLGGRFLLDLGVSAAGEGGYARALTDEERAEQQRRLGEHHEGRSTWSAPRGGAGAPGAESYEAAAMVDRMKPGSVIVDLAAETGGNCEMTRPSETVDATA